MTNISGLALSPDGRFLVTVTAKSYGDNKTFLGIWDFKTGRRVNRQERDSEQGVSLNFSRDGKYLADLTASGGTIFSVPDLRPIGEFKEFFQNSASFAREMVALPNWHQNRIRLWNLVSCIIHNFG